MKGLWFGHLLIVLFAWQNGFHETNERRGVVSGGFIIPGLPEKRFVKLGDINIGVLVPMSMYDRSSRCSERLAISSVQYTQVMEYAVKCINDGNMLPGNLTLGFVVLDDCYKQSAAVAQSLTFVPQTQCQGQEMPYNSTSASTGNDVQDSYDVVAVIGSSLSSQTEAVAHVLGPALVPLVSFFSTSDNLSNKKLFPYFLRTTSPDRFQFKAIFSIIKEIGWSYVSIVYMEGSYGENGFKQLRNLFDASGICLAAVHKVPTRVTDNEAEAIAKNLVVYRSARAVIIVTASTNAYKIIKAASELGPPGTFTWIGSDAWGTNIEAMQHLGDILLDTIVVSSETSRVPDYEEHFARLTLNDTADPWFTEFWETLFHCSASDGECDTNTTVSASGQSFVNVYSGHLMDTVNVLANATSRVLHSAQCRSLPGPAARACVTGPRLLNEILATRQNGYTGWIELDTNGDRLGRYIVRQAVPHTTRVLDVVPVAKFNSLTGSMSMVRNLSWVRNRPDLGRVHPESKCSYPCGPQEARVVQEVTCCWLCQLCRDNERLIRNGTRCEACPTFSWPDPVTYNSTCLPIPPDRPRLNSVMGVVQTSLAILCLLACLVVSVFFYRHRQCRVIMASSRELSMLMLLAIATGYVVMGTLLSPPTDFTCRFNFLFFCTSFTLLYGSLLVRALRIFRIFEASKRTARQPRLINSKHQLMFCIAFLFIQLITCTVIMMIHPKWHKLTQSSPQERYVELACDLPMTGLVSFLAYNLLLVAVCTVLAFKTRHLPDNFNESRFISMCVSTKLVILLCFIPAYLVSGRELLKMQMLALAVALNHSVALIFLFLPKIYAVLYVEEATISRMGDTRRGTARLSGISMGGTGASISSRVHNYMDSNGGAAWPDNGSGRGNESSLDGSVKDPRKVTVMQVRPATITAFNL